MKIRAQVVDVGAKPSKLPDMVDVKVVIRFTRGRDECDLDMLNSFLGEEADIIMARVEG